MKTIVIPQFYRGPSGQKGLYNRQEVGLARAFAALGCRAVVLYPEPGAKAPKVETPEPNVKICYLPAVAFGTQMCIRDRVPAAAAAVSNGCFFMQDTSLWREFVFIIANVPQNRNDSPKKFTLATKVFSRYSICV